MVNRIIELIKHKGMSVNAVEKQLGFGNGAIKRFATSSPSVDKIVSLSNFLNVSVEYIITGKENAASLKEDELELLTYYKKIPHDEQLKLIGRAETLADVYKERQQIKMMSASEDATECVTVHYFNDPASAGTGVELGAGECEDMKLQSNTITQKADIVIRVKGNSMEPQFYDNDLVVVRLTPSVEVGEIGIFRIGGEKGVIKKKGTDRLISLNPDYEDIYYDGSEEIDTIGRVVGVLKPEWIIR